MSTIAETVDRKPTVLITGFEAFGSFASNPTALGVRRLRDDAEFADRVVGVVLPVTFDGASRIVRAWVQRVRPDAVVMFGLAASATALRVEFVARNAVTPTLADNAGRLQASGSVRADAPATILAGSLPVKLIDALAERGVPAARSDDAGGFVCNATYFSALSPELAPRGTVFVHVPAGASIGGRVEDEEIWRWMRAVVDVVLGVVEKPAARGVEES